MNCIKCVGVLALSLTLTMPALAQSPLAEINEKAVTLLAGEAIWADTVQGIAQSLQHRDGMRILPMQGDGCLTSTADVMQLTQVDAAVLETACVDYAMAQGLLPQALEKLVYVSRVDTQPLLLVTKRSFTSLTSLAGKRIATGPAQTAGFAAGELLLADTGLPFVRVPQSGAEAIALLKLGQADAVLVRGTGILAGLDSAQFHVFGLEPPPGGNSHFAPALVSESAMNGLATTDIETVSTALVLVAYDWPRKSVKADKINRFAAAYVAQAATTQAGEVSARVPGWKRHAVAEKTLKQLAQKNVLEMSLTQNGGTP